MSRAARQQRLTRAGGRRSPGAERCALGQARGRQDPVHRPLRDTHQRRHLEESAARQAHPSQQLRAREQPHPHHDRPQGRRPRRPPLNAPRSGPARQPRAGLDAGDRSSPSQTSSTVTPCFTPTGIELQPVCTAFGCLAPQLRGAVARGSQRLAADRGEQDLRTGSDAAPNQILPAAAKDEHSPDRRKQQKNED